MRQRTYYTTEEKLQLLTNFFESGLSAKKFAEQNNIKNSTFCTWRRWYKNAKNSWQAGDINGKEINESQPEFKDPIRATETSNDQYRIIKIQRKTLIISCDKSILRDVIDVLNNYD